MTKISLASSEAVSLFIRPQMNPLQEEFWALALNSNLQLIEAQCLFRGTVDGCWIHPRDIFRYALEKNASRLILCHSHPNGEAYPSTEDLSITRDLLKISKFMQIAIEDHIIIAPQDYYSLRQHGLI